MSNPTNGGRRGRHRRRVSATVLLLGVPVALVSYFVFIHEDSQAATVDGSAYYRLVSVRSGKVLDVNSFSTADGTRPFQNHGAIRPKITLPTSAE